MTYSRSTSHGSTQTRKVNCIAQDNQSISISDHLAVQLSSIFFVGSVIWVPSLFLYLYKKWKNSKDDVKKRTIYRNLLLALIFCTIFGPHRHYRVGKWLGVKKWKLWDAWLRYIAFQVITDDNDDEVLLQGNSSSGTTTRSSSSSSSSGNHEQRGVNSYNHSTIDSTGTTLGGGQKFDLKRDPAILAFSPHGIFPFSLGFAVLPERAKDYFGEFRPVVATATRFYPMLKTILQWLKQVDASKSEVDRALSQGHRIGLAPGGISEMFEGYPKSGRHPDEECLILQSRKGFIKMALKHQVPVVPIYTFGSSKLLKRLQVPFLEKVSNCIRVSICFFYGVCGLPIPFQKKLLYAVGQPIHPPPFDLFGYEENGPEFEQQVDIMHRQFCDSLTRLFDKYKSLYGWDHKTLRIV